MGFLRTNWLIAVGLVVVFVAAVMAGRGSGSPFWIFLGAAIIALGATQRKKDGKDRGDAR